VQTSSVVKNLYGIWGSGPNDIYVVGEDGTILHSTGDGTWATQTSGVSVDLIAVWGSGSGDVYVVGGNETNPDQGVILHSTGNGTWTSQCGI